MGNCLELEIGASIAGMQNLRNLGIPDVDEWGFVPYSRVEMGGDGRPRGFGFPTATWTWSVLSQDQLNVLFDFFATPTSASCEVYVWVYEDTGHGLGSMRGRYLAVMSRPVDGSNKTIITGSTTPVYSDVSIQFSHMQAI